MWGANRIHTILKTNYWSPSLRIYPFNNAYNPYFQVWLSFASTYESCVLVHKKHQLTVPVLILHFEKNAKKNAINCWLFHNKMRKVIWLPLPTFRQWPNCFLAAPTVWHARLGTHHSFHHCFSSVSTISTSGYCPWILLWRLHTLLANSFVQLVSTTSYITVHVPSVQGHLAQNWILNTL